MIICWLLSGLVAGIAAAHFSGQLTLLWIFCGASILFLLFPRTRKLAVFAVFLSLSFAITLLRLNCLHTPVYGESMSFTLRSQRLVQQGVDECAWLAKVLEPAELTGAKVLVYSESFQPGIYSAQGTLLPPVKYRNPNQSWHYLRKIYMGEIGVLRDPRIVQCQQYKPGLLERWRTSYRSHILANLGRSDSASLALALTVGDRSLLSSDLRASVYLTGVGHVLALSGLHIGILMGLILLALKAVGISRSLAELIGLGFLFLYLALVGPSPSLVRAVLMSAYATAAFLAGRERLGLPALLWSAAAMLLYNPLWLFDYAFVFSFVATLVCLTAGSRVNKYLGFLPESIARAAAMTLAVQAVLLPMTLFLFGSISLWAPLANMVIIPLMPFLTALSLLAGLPGLAGSVLAVPADLLLRGVADFLKLLAEIPLSLYFGGLPLALLAGGSVLLMLQLWGRARQYLAWILVLCVAISGLWILTDRLCCTIWFLDVGQADAILIRNRGNWILVDCGDAYAGEGAVVPALTFLGVRRLDALIITHSHDDHAGGLQAVLARFPVENVLVNGSFINSPWAELVPQARVVRGHYSLADNLHIYAHNLPLSEENDCSLLISLTAPGGSVLLTGDLQAEGERMYFGELSPHAVLKVAHHGSSSSTSEDFLRRVRPRTAVISCGLGNRYALPHGETLDRLRDSGAEILRTDVHGCVRMRFWPWPSYTVTTFTGR